MTKREMFAQVIEIVEASAVENKDELVEKLTHEIELLNRKSTSAKKPTKTQLENENFKAEIIKHLYTVDMPKSIKEMQAEIECLANLTNQRITHMLTALVKDGTLVKEYVKKTPYFSVVQS